MSVPIPSRLHFIPSLIPYAVLFAILILEWIAFLNFKVSTGDRFEQAPPLSGIYQCCSVSRHSSSSSVGQTAISCAVGGYFNLFASPRDCGLASTLNGQSVALEQTIVPGIFGDHLTVARISTASNIFKERSEAEIREIWNNDSLIEAVINALTIAYMIEVAIKARRKPPLAPAS